MDERDHAGVTTVANLQPFWSRAVVSPSVVDEDQTPSGLIIPHRHDGSEPFRRGVIVALDKDNSSIGPLEVGMVVYYRRGWRIRDQDVVDLDDILAFEPLD